MESWVVGLSTGSFYDRGILNYLEPIRDGGFPIIEICSNRKHLDYRNAEEVRRVAQRLRVLQMTACSFHAPFADHLDISAPDPVLRSRALSEMFEAVEAAAVLGAQRFVVHPGPEKEDAVLIKEHRERKRHTAASLRQLALRCSELGIEIVLENKLPHLIFGNSRDLLSFTTTLENLNPGICLDTGHAHLAGELPRLARKLRHRLRMIHAHDNHGKRDDHLPVGDGAIDWRHLLLVLDEIRFTGLLVLELGRSDDVESFLTGARCSRDYITKISGEIPKKQKRTSRRSSPSFP
jgi:sugar phosphate isomerase/epimerase